MHGYSHRPGFCHYLWSSDESDSESDSGEEEEGSSRVVSNSNTTSSSAAHQKKGAMMCPRCKRRRLRRELVQKRSADEGMSVYLKCRCGYSKQES